MWRGIKAWLFVVGLLAVSLALAAPEAAAQNAQAEVSVNTSGGFARVVFNFSEDVESYRSNVERGFDHLVQEAGRCRH